jgi:hypothetical protein
MEDTSTLVERALREAMAELDDLHVTSTNVPRSVTIEFWRGIAERATERADTVQEELDEHGESDPPDDDDAFDGDEDGGDLDDEESED